MEVAIGSAARYAVAPRKRGPVAVEFAPHTEPPPLPPGEGSGRRPGGGGSLPPGEGSRLLPVDPHPTLRADFLASCDDLNLDATFEPARVWLSPGQAEA